MIKYNKIKIYYYSAPVPPYGIYMDRIYTIFKKNGYLYITDGNAEIKIDEFFLKMSFLIKDDIEWKDVDFSDDERSELKPVKQK